MVDGLADKILDQRAVCLELIVRRRARQLRTLLVDLLEHLLERLRARRRFLIHERRAEIRFCAFRALIEIMRDLDGRPLRRHPVNLHRHRCHLLSMPALKKAISASIITRLL